MFTQAALNALTVDMRNNHNIIYVPSALESAPLGTAAMPNIEHFYAPVVHPKMGKVITNYAKLADNADPELRKTWRNGMGKEFGNMAPGDEKTGTSGTNAIFVLDLE